MGEYIESTCRAGSGRGLYFQVSTLSGSDHCRVIFLIDIHVVQDITFRLFRNKHRKAEFAMQVVKDAKGMTFTPNEVGFDYPYYSSRSPKSNSVIDQSTRCTKDWSHGHCSTTRSSRTSLCLSPRIHSEITRPWMNFSPSSRRKKRRYSLLSGIHVCLTCPSTKGIIMRSTQLAFSAAVIGI